MSSRTGRPRTGQPHTGRSGTGRRAAGLLAAGLLAGGAVGAACSDDEAPPGAPRADDEPTGTGTGVTAARGSTPGTPDPSGTDAPTVTEELAWALEYTGGVAGAATGEPVRIGYVGQDDLFPGHAIGVAAAAEYVNGELGGLAGRPMEIVPCAVQVAADGARCGALLADDPDVLAVVTGAVGVGGRELYRALDGRVPVIIGDAVTSDDLTTPAGVTLRVGSTAVVPGVARFVIEHLGGVETVAVLVEAGPAGSAVADLLFRPVTDAAGIATVTVPVDDVTTADAIAAELDAATPDVVVPLLPADRCLVVAEALDRRDVDVEVVTTDACVGAGLVEYVAAGGGGGARSVVPDGWYLAGDGSSPFLPDVDSGTRTALAVLEVDPGLDGLDREDLDRVGLDLAEVGEATASVADLLTLARLINGLGPDGLQRALDDPAVLDTALRSFDGPMMMQVGPLACGDRTVVGLPVVVALCAAQIGVQQQLDGAWTSVRDGLNGRPVEVPAT